MYRIDDIEIDVERQCLVRSGEETHLRRKSFEVLAHLVANRHRLVSKRELFDSVWSGSAVTDDVLVQCIKDVRRALGDDPHRPRFIKTVPRSGYRFIGPVSEHHAEFTEEITHIEFEIEDDGVAAPLITRPALAGRRSDRRALFAAAAVLLCALGGIAYFALPRASSTADVRLRPVEGRKPLAVMFFDARTPDSDIDWLREGLADMLITNLSRSERLTVLSRQQLSALLDNAGLRHSQEAFDFDSAVEIAAKSGAEIVLTGSFVRSGNVIRVDAQLHNVASRELIAAESLTVDDASQIFAQVDVLSLKLAQHLNAAAPPPDLATAMTRDLEAYRLYSLSVTKAHALENKEAERLLREAISRDPEFAMAHARLGYTYAVTWGLPDEGRPHLEKAFSLASRLTERDKRNIIAWYAIANRDYPAAIDAYREIVRLYPLDSEGYWRLGKLLAGEERSDEAISVLRQGLAVDRDSGNLYNSLGAVLSGLGKHSEAIAAHQRYVALAPNSPNAYDSLGLTYQWAGEREKAIENFRRAIEIDPSFEVAMIHLAYNQIREGQYRAAFETIDRYSQLAVQPGEKARAHDSKAYVHLQRGDLDAAERESTRHISLNPNGSPWTGYVVAVRKKQSERARKLEQDVMSIWNLSERGSRGSRRFPIYFKGMIALNEGRGEEAIALFQQALTHRAPSWHFEDFEDCLGIAYLKLGRYDEAIAEFERVLQLSPNYPRARFHIARAYREKGMSEEAKANYQRFLTEWKNADADLPEIVEARSF